jgi:hypothetical protein
MKSIFTIKPTLSFNIINNKMSTKIFKNYQNPQDLLTLEEVRGRIEDLTTSIRGNESYYRRRQTEVLTKEQREEILLENEIQDEIDFYESQVDFYESRGISDEEDIKKYVNKMAASYFNNDKEDEEDEEEDEQPYYHINDYCDPYLGKESPPIPDFDSDEEEEPKSKIDFLEKKLDGVENVVYQLIGGLFNQSTQTDMIESHLCCLRGNEYPNKIDEEIIWPTTRQGDQHEEEIQLLKQQVSRLEDTVALLVNVIKNQIGVNIDISSI